MAGGVGERPRVAVPAAFNKAWLEQKLHGKVTGALHKVDDNGRGAGHVAHTEGLYMVPVHLRLPCQSVQPSPSASIGRRVLYTVRYD